MNIQKSFAADVAEELADAAPELVDVARDWLAAAATTAAADAEAAIVAASPEAAARWLLLAQERSWLRDAAAAVRAQEADAANCVVTKALLDEVYSSYKEAKMQVINAQHTVDIQVAQDDEVAPEVYRSLEKFEEAAAALARRVEGCLDHLRTLQRRGLPEAAALLDKHPAAQPPKPAARAGAADESPLEFNFRKLVREGVALPGRGREDYVDVTPLKDAHGSATPSRTSCRK